MRAALAALISLVLSPVARSQSLDEFHRTFAVATAEPVTLDIDLSRADLQVLYSRVGQISVTARMRSPEPAKLNPDFLKTAVRISQEANHFTLSQSSDPGEGTNVLYTLDVPYRTAVIAKVRAGNQTFSGIMGPVKASVGKGDIKASYISGLVQADVATGNINLEVVGEHASATVGEGNISGSRLPLGVTAEAGDGDITLIVVGPSSATIKTGKGRIEAAGIRGSLAGRTALGDIHIKAVPHDDWQLTSDSGDLRLELPPRAAFDLDTSGQLQTERDDIQKANPGLQQMQQKVNGGGKLIAAHTQRGRILIR